MSEDVARAVGAKSPATINIAGKEVVPRPLGVRELCEVQRACLEHYKRSYLKTFTDNKDLLGDSFDVLLREKFEEAGKWDVGDLPHKYVYDADRINASEKLKAWIKDEFGMQDQEFEFSPPEFFQRIAASCLDQGLLPEDKLIELTGQKPYKFSVPYPNWWITGCFDGMVEFVWICFRDSGVDKDQVIDAAKNDPTMLASVARQIESLSTPQMGNG